MGNRITLSGQEAAHNSQSCTVSACGATNPMAGILARQIIEQINAGREGLAAGHASEAQMQTAGGKQQGPTQGRG